MTDRATERVTERVTTRRSFVAGGVAGGGLLAASGFVGRAEAVLKSGFGGEEVMLSAGDRDFLLESADIPRAGNPGGGVVLAEFSDFRCPYCRSAAADVRSVLERDSDLLVVFPNFPLLGRESVKLALLALAAHRQGLYEEWHFAAMTWPGRLRASKADEIAERLGLDLARMEADADREELREALRANQRFAERFEIKGIPTFLAFARRREEVPARLLRGGRSDDELAEIFRLLREAA
ncbi:MAG: DsbA family protein [Alphaproteobacteria bacterium]|nr:DsbA family protein [Alphaproteobacteria bacterium]